MPNISTNGRSPRPDLLRSARPSDALPASYQHTASGLVELEPAAGGFYADRPPFDVSHGELVSTVRDYTRFARMLADGGHVDGRRISMSI
jgi:CubicO group peptidase (beta-lactamase class C family)